MTATTQPSAIGARVARRVQQDLGEQKFAMWFDRTARFDYREDRRMLSVAVPNRFAADWIGRNFHKDLTAAARAEAGDDVQVDLLVAPERFQDGPTGSDRDQATRAEAAVPRVNGSAQASRGATEKPKPSAASQRYRLDQFVTGPNNQLGFAAAAQAADLDNPAGNHPLFLHGDCGVGKTHLLQGIVHAAKAQRLDAKVRYLTGEQFTNQYITALRAGKVDAFRKRMRRLDLLAIDDIHFIASKEKTQQEFLHCFQDNDLAGARVVLASDTHPRLIQCFSEALVSRCVCGMVVELTEPDPATRRAIIGKLALRRGLFLQPAVIDTLAKRFDGSVREIEGALTRLHALATLIDRKEGGTDAPRQATRLIPVGHALLDQLPELAYEPVRRPVRLDTIIKTVCERLLLEPKQLASSSRHKAVVLARSLVVHLARELTPMSYPEIALGLGRKNHSTVITACQRMGRQLEADAPVMLPGGAGPTTPSELVHTLRRQIARMK